MRAEYMRQYKRKVGLEWRKDWRLVTSPFRSVSFFQDCCLQFDEDSLSVASRRDAVSIYNLVYHQVHLTEEILTTTSSRSDAAFRI